MVYIYSLCFQVHVFLTSCANILNFRATCTCAVAVQSGDDVIVFDRCGLLFGPMNVMSYINGELTPGTNVYSFDNGASYRVCFFFSSDFNVFIPLCIAPATLHQAALHCHSSIFKSAARNICSNTFYLHYM